MSELQKLQQIQILINESQLHFNTPDRLILAQYIESQIKLITD